MKCSKLGLSDPTYEYNHQFDVLSGGQFFLDGQLRFTPGEEKPDGAYRTVFGPSFSHNGVVYCNCNDCVSLAFRRLTAVRKPEEKGLDRQLTINQNIFVQTHQWWFKRLSLLYEPYFIEWESMEEAARLHHADPHPKRLLREQAWRDLNEAGDEPSRLWLRSVWYKLKCDEIAKPGKVPRMIGDLGVAASLQGFYLTKLLKEAQASEPIFINGGRMEFISTPNPWRLEHVFKCLIDPPERFFFAYFSDDSCISIRIGQKIFTFNLDISKCDASHGPSAFSSMVQIFPEALRDDANRLVEQCRLPIEIRSRAGKEKVKLKPRRPKLYSGATITTVMNNNANTSIGLAISEHEFADNSTVEQVAAGIVAAAAKAGYLLSVEHCPIIEDIQFLKNSPVYDVEGVMRPLLNLGVMLRASGTCKGDLPGKGDLELRARQFQSAILHGMYPRCSFPLLDAMKSAVGCEPSVESTRRVTAETQYKVENDDTYPLFSVSTAAVYKRYRLTPLAQAELAEFSSLSTGYHLSSTAVDLILGKDYGLSRLDS